MYKGKKQAADKGYNLLKKKADALKARLQRMLKEIYQVRALCIVPTRWSLMHHFRRRKWTWPTRPARHFFQSPRLSMQLVISGR